MAMRVQIETSAEDDKTVAVILADEMVKVIDVFRDIDQNFRIDDQFLLDDVASYQSLTHLFSNILAHAEGEIVTSVLMIYKTCVVGNDRDFLFRPLGSPLASRDEIALLILLSAAQRGRYGIAGESALRLGCRQSLIALRAAYEFTSWLSDTGLEIGAIDARLMQWRPTELADALIESCMEKLEFSTAASKHSRSYARRLGV